MTAPTNISHRQSRALRFAHRLFWCVSAFWALTLPLFSETSPPLVREAKYTPPPPIPWRVEGRLLGRECFTIPSVTGDYFEEYQDRFHIQNLPHFLTFPGEYMGREINYYGVIKPSWYRRKGDEFSIIKPVASCAVSDSDAIFKEGYVTQNIKGLENYYRVLGKLTRAECASLAPHIGVPCLESRIVETQDYSGGSIGWYIAYSIYGLFELDDVGTSIVPLRYFRDRDDALAFIRAK